MSDLRLPQRGTSIVLVGVLVAACAAGGSTGHDSPPTVAAPSATPSAPATALETPPATVAPDSANPSSVAAAPPIATLVVDGGDPVAGQLGSYTWNGGGSDSPWLPGAAIAMGAGERLMASFDPDVAVAAWSARRAAAGTTDGSGAVGLGDAAGPIVLGPLTAGQWSLQLTVGFADELGSAVYYWDVTVR